MSNKGIDQIAFLVRDNDRNAWGWKYGLTNNYPVTRFTKAWRAAGKDWTQYRSFADKHGGNK